MATTFASSNLHGSFLPAPDKSISHRAIIFASMAIGTSEVSNLLEGEDVMHTMRAMQSCGVQISKSENKWLIHGNGAFGLHQPRNILDLGNSGTSARLLMGVFSPYSFPVFISGDSSLSTRPMARVMDPLSQMGTKFTATSQKFLPLCIQGRSDLMPIIYEMQVPSAQVKSAILLAGLQIRGTTTVVENIKTRDHTENMLSLFGADVSISNNNISINGGKELSSQNISVPGDPSSAAFLIAAAILTPNSHIVVENVCINKSRIGFYDTLIKMGANIQFTNIRTSCGEKISDISASSSSLSAVDVSSDIAPSMIDEYPILAVCASFANGKSIFKGLKELTVKESNRLAAIESNLSLCGIDVHANYETFSLEITGNNNDAILGGCTIKTNMDHRIAMSFIIMGLRSKNGITIDDTSFINTSFPGFLTLLQKMNCRIEI